MFHSENLWLVGVTTASWVAQLPAEAVAPEDAALIFSGPRFFVALVAGLVLAFGFQLLLTNLSVAAGISVLGGRSSDSHSSDSHSSSSGSVGSTVQKIGVAVGIWTLITVTLALFVACLLAVKLSLINDRVLGGIVGLVIWATYFCLLVWISSTTVGSLIGSVVNAATSGFQAILGTATSAIGAKVAKDQIVSTAEAAAIAVRREFTSGLDAESIRENLEDYINRLRPAQLDIAGMRQEFDRLLNDPELLSADPEALRGIDRQAFLDLVSSRTDLSKRDANRIVDQLELAWRQAIGRSGKTDRIGELVDFLKSGDAKQLVSGNLDQRLSELVDELRQRRQADEANKQSSQVMGMGLASQVVNGLMAVVMGRGDLSDLSVEQVVGKLKDARDQLGEQTAKLTSGDVRSYSVVREDVESYLLNTYSWQMTPQTAARDFRDVLYDTEADPTTVRKELESLNRLDFVNLLQSRGVFTQDRINTLSFELEAVRRQVLHEVTEREEAQKLQTLGLELEGYLKLAPKEDLLNPGVLAQDLRPILSDADSTTERLRDRFSKFSAPTLITFMESRADLTFEEKQRVAAEIERLEGIVAADSEGIQQAATARVSTQWQRLEDYLRNTGKDELNPEGIRGDLQTLLNDPQAGTQDLRTRLSRFDRGTLVALLSQRQDLSETEANRIVDDVEGNWYRLSSAPQLVAAKATEQYDKTTTAIADYLRNTQRSELDPDDIQRDLKLLLNDPKVGARALGERLSRMDRGTLVALLSQREDLSEAEVNRIIDDVQETIRSVIRTPRRLALRTQTQLRDFRTSLEDYLRNTGKEELDPDDIKRDLQLLLNDPRLGFERMSDRLSQIDRSTLVALLSQREDMTEAEANQIVDRVLSVRDQITSQIRMIQYRIQSAIQRVLNAIRDYLNALERPELNYDGITQDVRTLFDDPQAGFEALRDRLGQVDRGTMVALLSSREDISQADAERIIYQVERVRNSVLQRAERVQRQVQQRLEEVKYQAQKQVDETRKAAATAAWWLFATAVVSGIASAIAGGLAVGQSTLT